MKKLQRLTIVSDTFQWIYSDEKQEPLSNTYTILIGPNNFEFSKQFDFCNSVWYLLCMLIDEKKTNIQIELDKNLIMYT